MLYKGPVLFQAYLKAFGGYFMDTTNINVGNMRYKHVKC